MGQGRQKVGGEPSCSVRVVSDFSVVKQQWNRSKSNPCPSPSPSLTALT